MTRQEIAVSLIMAFFGVGGAAVVQVAPTLFPQHTGWMLYGGLGLLVLSLVGVGVVFFRARRHRSEVARSPAPSQNVTSHNQSGGITAHTVNIGNE